MTSSELELGVFGASITMAALGGPLLSLYIEGGSIWKTAGSRPAGNRGIWLWALTTWFVIDAILALVESITLWSPFSTGPAVMFSSGAVGLLVFLWFGLGLGRRSPAEVRQSAN